jgi:hypothetical protein
MEVDQFVKLLKEQGIEEDIEEVSDEFYAKWGVLFLQIDAALSSFIETNDLEGYNLFIELTRRIIATKLNRYRMQDQIVQQSKGEDFFWKALWNKDDEK